MSWRDRLAQRDRAARANAINANSAVSPPFGTNGTIGNAGLSKKRAARRAVRKLDDDVHGYFAESKPNWRAIAGVVSTGGADERDLASDSRGWTDGQNQGAAFVEYGAGIPRAWAEGFEQLASDCPPEGVPPKRWKIFIDDVGRFLDSDFACVAAALDWNRYNLFGWDRDRPFAGIDSAGVLWLLNGNQLVVLSENTATIETETRARLLYVRRRSELGNWFAWELVDRKPGGGRDEGGNL